MVSDPTASNSASDISNTSIGAKHQAVFCNDCNEKFSRSSSLLRHQRSAHEQSTKIFCNVEGCNQEFARKDARHRHVATIHGSHKWECPNCGFAVRKDSLCGHMVRPSCQKRGAVIAQRTGNPQQQDPRPLRPLAPAEHDNPKGDTASERLEQLPQCPSATIVNALDCGRSSTASEDQSQSSNDDQVAITTIYKKSSV